MKFIDAKGNDAAAKRTFCLTEEGKSDPTVHDFTQTFDLQGLGDKQNIDIVCMDERQSINPVCYQYATKHTTGEVRGLSRKLSPHLLTVRFSADNLFTPIDRDFKVYVSEDGYLRMETIK